MSFNLRAAAAALFLLPVVGQASTITTKTLTVGGDWETFDFNAGVDGGNWKDPDPTSLPTTDISFELNIQSGFAALQVTDAYWYGDEFEIYIEDAFNNVVTQRTSEVDPTPWQTLTKADAAFYNNNADFDAAFLSVDASSGEFILGAGTYTITGKQIASFHDQLDGVGGIRAVELVPTPLPGSFLLLLGGGAGLAAMAKRKKTAAKG